MDMNLRNRPDPTNWLTEREKELILRGCEYVKAYDDSNPDVGFGPGPWTIVERLLKGVSFKVNKQDTEELVERFKSYSCWQR